VSLTHYLLDTNAVSATRRPKTEPQMTRFLAAVRPNDLFLSVLTLGELRKGLILKEKRSRDGVAALSTWIDEVQRSYSDRTIAVDTEIAAVWGKLSADRSRAVIDTLLAATAIVHGLTLVTRNVGDFEGLPMQLHNPWQT
jgi:predicted nucleic acid-binding protein